ncbi:hypothetical protein ANN_08620 [Periplaneta americana]|uniref:DUF4817 domain-containing protein n=1 Tax=Periplaneta americana TaxID=6978 RepID=A0ABQ8T344_PERAM|nr:hypothetical protein ANN_08620 [Periplaneta americana]
MERWTVRERICTVENFIRIGSVTETKRLFRRQMNRHDAPSHVAIHRWVRQWREEGSTKNISPPGRALSVRTAENVARLQESVQWNPRRSANKHAVALQMSDRSVR